MLATTPPRESIGGRKRHQISAMERGISTYAYLLEIDELINSEEFSEMDTEEKELITNEFNSEILSYEKNQARVETY